MRRHRQKATVEPLPVPSKSATKTVWIAYALSAGVSEEELEGLKRDEIIELVNAQTTEASESDVPSEESLETPVSQDPKPEPNEPGEEPTPEEPVSDEPARE